MSLSFSTRVPGAAIVSHDCYNAELKKPIQEKLWFADKVDADIFVDFGCADGAVMKELAQISSQPRAYIGYDIDPDQCAAGRVNFPEALFTDNWADIEALLAISPHHRKCLILSSVVHELLSDAAFDLSGWWQKISCMFDMVVIRDMALSKSASTQETPSRWRYALGVRAENDVGFGRRMKSFESAWGDLAGMTSFMHFMLKYRYAANWEREVAENYVPLSAEDMIDTFTTSDFTLSYREHAILPWLQQRVYADFGIRLSEATHIKMILNRLPRQ